MTTEEELDFLRARNSLFQRVLDIASRLGHEVDRWFDMVEEEVEVEIEYL